MIGGISSSRREQVAEIDLDEAVAELEQRARRVEISCPNEVLRVLQELGRLRELVDGFRDQVEDAGFGLPEHGLYLIVAPDSRNANQEHVQPPDEGRTCCGYGVEGWEVVDELTAAQLRERLQERALCDRCRRSLHIRLPR